MLKIINIYNILLQNNVECIQLVNYFIEIFIYNNNKDYVGMINQKE